MTDPASHPAPKTPTRVRLRPGNLVLALLRRLLYLVIRTRVTPGAPGAGHRPDKPICYVLEDRHLSSLLVLEEETRRFGLPVALEPIGMEFPIVERAVFTVIVNRNPLSTRTAEPSAMLTRMTAALMRDPSLDVQLVPVTILWGRSPKSQDSLVRALFADAGRVSARCASC
jgi:glycerol-3-phosphate O-acyltransferase